MNRTLILTLTILAIFQCACQGHKQFIGVVEDHTRRTCQAEVTQANWIEGRGERFVEVEAKCGGWWLHCFIRVPTGEREVVRDRDVESQVFWNDHVFPFRWGGAGVSDHLDIQHDGETIRVTGVVEAQLRRIDGVNTSSKKVDLRFDVTVSKTALAHSMMVNSRFAELSSVLRGWRQSVAGESSSTSVGAGL